MISGAESCLLTMELQGELLVRLRGTPDRVGESTLEEGSERWRVRQRGSDFGVELGTLASKKRDASALKN